MHLWEVIIVSTGLSLEAFNIAVIKGANQRQLPKHMLFFMSLFFGAIITAMLAVGIVIVVAPQRMLNLDSLLDANRWFSALILFFLGGKMLRKIKKDKHVEERLEANITYREVGILALRAGIDAVLLGIVFGFLETAFSSIYIMFIIVSLSVGLGLWLGERLGIGYRAVINTCSGILLVAMGIKIILNFFEMI